MKPHDPDFPEEIPAIPDAQDAPSQADAVAHTAENLTSQDSPSRYSASQDSPSQDPTLEGYTAAEYIAEGHTAADRLSNINPPNPDPVPPSFSASKGRQGPPASLPPRVNPHLSAPPNSRSELPPEDVWTEMDEAGPEMNPLIDPRLEARAGQKNRVKPDPAMGRSGSTAAERREAEKPVYETLPYDDWDASEVPYQPKELGVIDQFLLLLADGATTWRKVLRWVRSLLPPQQQRQLSDEILTAIILGLLMLLLALWNPLGGRSQASVSPGATAGMAVVEAAEPNLETAPSTASPLAPSPEEAPPILEPSPEQNLIADIQTQVSKISRSYAVGLIQSVEVNLPEQVLVVNVGHDWYGLIPAQQDAIAQDIYTQAQGLAFSTLQLRDPEGGVVARNPVVGSTMVVLKRHRADAADLGNA